MSKAQRYDHGRIGMIPTDCGHWYQASDYAKLEAEAQALREEVADARRDAERHELRANQYSEELAALRARVVVIPDRLEEVGIADLQSAALVTHANAWNACLDELARLNGKAVSEGLLRRLLEFVEDGIETPNEFEPQHSLDARGFAKELRALLDGEGKAP